MKKKVLFISSSIGLGHAARDLAIVKELRKRDPDIEVSWLAGDPALRVIQESGEYLLPECKSLGEESKLAEKVSNGFEMNVNTYLFRVLLEWRKSIVTINRLTKREKYDLIIADEAYELILAYFLYPRMKRKAPFVMIYDFFGFDATTKSPLEKLGTYFWNFAWITINRTPWVEDLSLYVGNAEDIADKSYGLGLPNARKHGQKHYKFLGNILPFNPHEYRHTSEMKSRLGYGEGPLIICSVGGTSIGVDLLNLCSRTYKILREKIPELQMVLIAGPRIDPNSITATEGIQIRGYVPKLYEHLAACDLAIVQGGGTTTMELVALNKNFLYFPIEEHFEQKLVSDRLIRMGAGVKIRFSETDENTLSTVVLDNIEKGIEYKNTENNGAVKAAEYILNQLR
ncbi:glycosyltransferase [Niallia sp. Krafla_26]|uniref:glycosyltransferase n=1 Tax=Niallia sp. Krafla_26 TaxID=3064703 RepID=UPI003D174B15